ncbi:MAG: hypothetical protein ACYDEJ_11995 [Desulfitobacteriaceae bacterium]
MIINIVGLFGGTVCVLLAITLFDHQAWFGALLGYWLGFANSQLLYRETDRVVQGTVWDAIKRMRRGFFVRISVLSLVVVGIARFQRAWLPSLVVGIAVGIPLSLIFILRRHILRGKG